MTPLRELEYELDKWCPFIVALALKLLLLLPRIVVCLLLPADAHFSWHPMNKIHEFWRQ